MADSRDCTNCLSEVTDIYVKCAECTDFGLCLQCFSSGAEIGKHKNNHKYEFQNCANFPLFKHPEAKWTARDELSLLEGITDHGYGNWMEVASSQENAYCPEELQDHYNSTYVLGNISEFTWDADQPSTIIDHTCEDGPSSPSLAECSRPIEMTSAQKQELGYSPLRDDFEKELENSAETLISSLSFSPTDDDLMKSLKLAHLSIYSNILKRRSQLKKMARQYNKIQEFFNTRDKTKLKVNSVKKKKFKMRCGNYREFKDLMKIYSRFFSEAELSHFFGSLQRESELKSKALELIKLRRRGFTTVKDAYNVDLVTYKMNKKGKKFKPVCVTTGRKSSLRGYSSTRRSSTEQ